MQRVRISSQQAPVHKLGDSQMTLSPKFRLLAVQSTLLDPSLHLQLSRHGEPLIPGLPDDVALQCLLRVPVDKHLACKTVCKRWYSLFGCKEHFFTQRKELGFHDPWLFVFAYHKCTGKIEWKVLDLVQFSWHTIPAMPCKDRVCPQGFRCVSVPHDGSLYVCGGVVSDVDCPLNLVLKYQVLKNRWTVMKKMNTARSFFASGVIDGTIYVAGGNSSDMIELSSAEALDTRKGTWQSVASMGKSMTSYDAAVLNGKLLVTEGWFWPFYVVPRGQVYDPATDSWENMAAGLREGWTGSSVVMYGHLFVVTEHERTKVKFYDENEDCWEVVEGPALPEQICKPFCVNSWAGRIYVVGRNLHVAVGHVMRVRSCGKKQRFCVQWQMVDAPDTLFDLTPSSAQLLFA
ncbi:F-box/kelch-repeat protein At1g30090-like [Andrographis paniculata]|uniref:F-box/kelch-repeat protein At1g30090-like n=1 Tax=Andrographis paniculata TaxID=175694 RepID=UPI0021E8E862|nr:F-box/kelch-repeat protein At1g30090-like [Andrographis paniculata]XP_051129008.1 F-box/kelch-repeat protein At1g30090-like [Andrographis paniculata]XP_051129009.1 F-box/kelch-repeat protein At1g30090-like [Andrographis paniculata]